MEPVSVVTPRIDRQVRTDRDLAAINAIELEITTQCNTSCPQCPRTTLTDNWVKGEIGTSDLERLLGKIEHVENIILGGWGEPLLHDAVGDVIARLVEAGKGVTLVTNGTLPLPVEVIALLDGVVFHLRTGTAKSYENDHPGVMFNRVAYHISQVVHWRRANGTLLPRISLQFDKDRRNFDRTKLYLETAAWLGADHVKVQAANFHFRAEDAAWALDGMDSMTRRVDHELEQAARDLGLGLDNQTAASQTFCLSDPRHTMFVNFQGRVAPCKLAHLPVCDGYYNRYIGQHPLASHCITFGNIFSEPLEKIWQRPRYQRFRKNCRPPFDQTSADHICRYCHPNIEELLPWAAG